MVDIWLGLGKIEKYTLCGRPLVKLRAKIEETPVVVGL